MWVPTAGSVALSEVLCTPPGMDWDELEEQAKREDREQQFSDEDNDDRMRKRKAGGGGSGRAAGASNKTKR